MSISVVFVPADDRVHRTAPGVTAANNNTQSSSSSSICGSGGGHHSVTVAFFYPRGDKGGMTEEFGNFGIVN